MENDRILVVDDDPDILRILKDNLELDGYPVSTAATGSEALALLEQTEPSLIILDLSLPDTDGIQICRMVRARSDVPIIMLTARDRVPDKVLGLETGADDYIVKPFDYLELAARARACLRRNRSRKPRREVIRLGGLEIDAGRNSVLNKGHKVLLTQREFALLIFLARNAGVVVKRSAIKQALWPHGGIYQDSRAIDVHIQHLRSKLETNPVRPRYILTVAGAGYMLVNPDES